VEHFRALAGMLAMPCAVIGAAAEQPLARAIPSALDLTGRTDLAQLASLARAARIAIGNDTGPMHLLAAAGCPSLVLFSRESDPALCAPRGPVVRVLRRPDLASLDAATVRETAAAMLAVSAPVAG
jgi:ADP-heptose:LPS heptosyltransferase